MKRSFPLRFLPAIGALAFLFTASIIAAQSTGTSSLRSNDGSNDGSKESRKIKIKLVRDNGKVVTITQFVGKMITVKFDSRRFGFMPKIDGRTGEVSLVLHRIEDIDGEATKLATELETIPINKVSPARSSVADLPFSLLLHETSDTKSGTERPLATTVSSDWPDQGKANTDRVAVANLAMPVAFARLGQASQRVHYLIRGSGVLLFQSGNCCVTCDGLESCGCAVEADCGSCCAPRCCDFLL